VKFQSSPLTAAHGWLHTAAQFPSSIIVPAAWAGFRSGNDRKGNTMATGTVKFFNDAKGFGFVTPDGGGKDLFAHHTEIEVSGFKSLKENQKVEYEVKDTPKGPAATRIRPLG
jgi:CspA family cold shock protein